MPKPLARMMTKSASRFLPAIVFFLTFVTFLPALSNGFLHWQDTSNLIDTSSYRSFNWVGLTWMFTTLHGGHYQPLTWLSFAVDYGLWGLDPFGYHLTNLIIHSANAALVYVVAAQLLPTDPPYKSDVNPILCWTAAVAVLAFSLHPLRVESVAWISNRNNLLSVFFLLAGLAFYLRSRQITSNNAARWKWMCGSIAAHLLSILAGANGFELPVLLILMDIYSSGRAEGGARAAYLHRVAMSWLEKLPFFTLGVARTITLAIVGANPSKSIDFVNVMHWQRPTQLFYEAFFYLWKTAVPTSLRPAYELPEVVSAWQPFVILGGVMLFSGFVYVLFLRTSNLLAPIAWAGYLTMVLIPHMPDGLGGVRLVADRYSYLPSLVLAVVSAAALRRWFKSSGEWRLDRLARAGISAGAIVATGVLCFLTWRQFGLWRDEEKLWRHAVAVDPQSRQARQKLADLLRAENKDDEAVQLYRQAARDNPDSALVHADLAELLVSRGKIDEARRLYQRAVGIDANLPRALFGMGNLLAMQGDFDGAIARYRKVLESMPSAAFVHVNLGYALARRGQPDDAIFHFRRALQLDPFNANAHFNLANILATRGQVEEAARSYREVLKILPGHAKAHYGFANLLIKTGHRQEAIEHYQEAVKYAPDQAEPYYALGLILADQTRFDSAIAYFRHALGIQPDFTEARLSLARALAAQGNKQDALNEYKEAKRLLQADGNKDETR